MSTDQVTQMRSAPRQIVDVKDVQGNILRPYAFGSVSHLLLVVKDAAKARKAVGALLPEVTTGEYWHGPPPETVLNIALSATGLRALQVPDDTVASFPYAFRAGMKARALILGDTGTSAKENWDKAWQGDVHAVVTIHARLPAPQSTTLADRVAKTKALLQPGFEIVGEENGARFIENDKPTGKEHFGYADGISQIEIEGFGNGETTGDGKLTPTGWTSLAAGELLFGYKDEADEYAPPLTPAAFGQNGTFLVFRKLKQNVALFRQYLEDQGAQYPGGKEKLAAKFIGRWRDGTPLVLSPDHPDPKLAADDTRNNDFRYAQDPDGARCPLGAHIRRARPRDAMGFGGKLGDRRRIMRRGLPYGSWAPDGQPVDDSPRGVLFIAYNIDYERQFEFIQQQWLNYGNHFRQGNDKDVVLGDHDGTGKAVIQADGPGKPPHLCTGLNRFVDVRGGEYFFVPGIKALGWIAGL